MRQKQNILLFGFGTLALLASFFLDRAIFTYVQASHSSALDYIFGWLSSIVTMVVVLLVMTSLFLWEEKKRDWIIPLWAAAVLGFILSYALKFIVARERPVPQELFGLADYSFPSSHATVSFAVLPILDREYPSLKWFWLLFAVLVALSRIYLQAHYLSDVVFGMLLGLAVGKTVLFLKRKHGI